MNNWRDYIQRVLSIFKTPDGMSFFLDLYSWESILFCMVAPLFLAVPIMLIVLAVHFHFFVCLILILIALIMSYPWLVVPFWIVKMKSHSRQRWIVWGFYNASVSIVYLCLFVQ